MSETTISVVIPMYNAERHLRDCLGSVEGQTFRDFECLCIDDGSTDGTGAIAGGYSARDPRFKVHAQANAGCSAARNRGVRLAAAPYLFFLDADDVLHPQAFEILNHLIERHEADVSSFQYSRVPDAFTLSAPVRYELGELPVTVDASPFRSFISGKDKRESAAVWPRLYRKSVVGDILFPEGVHFAEDLVFVAKVMHRIRSLAATPVALLYYRDNPVSATHSGVSERQLRSFAQAAQDLHAFFRRQPLSQQERRRVSAFISTMAYKTCVVPFVRGGRQGENGALLTLAHGAWLELVGSGAADPASLSLRKRLIARCFSNNWQGLGRRLDALVTRKGR